ncbi:MAG: hypothetical protein EXR84_08860 [Gammaproteobacteria bacterium]|nr:hypothetical protein [Gammaproteobacteria bacterium]
MSSTPFNFRINFQFNVLFSNLAKQKLATLVLLLLSVFAPVTSTHAQIPDLSQVQVTRLLDQPIITPGIDPSIGVNIQGPSVIKVPEWVANQLGAYYLYFADHKGDYIRLAYADVITGPWQIYAPGSLQLEQSHFLTSPPEVSDERIRELEAERRSDTVQYTHDLRTEITSTHIASPDVHVDNANQRIVMYYHGLAGLGSQHSRVATSTDGIHFDAQPQNLGRTYMRAFAHDDMTYVMSMPGQFYRSRGGFTDFETGPLLFQSNMRHAGLLQRGDTLYVFWTRVGDVPESIMVSTIDISGDWQQWKNVGERIVLKPEFEWEGANAPLLPSMRSTAYGLVNQLRDPAIFVEGDAIYLFYAVGGESGIALAKIELGEGQ